MGLTYSDLNSSEKEEYMTRRNKIQRKEEACERAEDRITEIMDSEPMAVFKLVSTLGLSGITAYARLKFLEQELEQLEEEEKQFFRRLQRKYGYDDYDLSTFP